VRFYDVVVVRLTNQAGELVPQKKNKKNKKNTHKKNMKGAA